jgi:hypothetical protein
MSHPRKPLENTALLGPVTTWPDSDLPSDQLNSLEQLLESFGQTPPIVGAVAEGLAELRSQRQDFDDDCKQRFDALWDVVLMHTMQSRFPKATGPFRRRF